MDHSNSLRIPPIAVELRTVEHRDLETLYAQQCDVEAQRLAAFPARDRAAFFAHWSKLLAHLDTAPRAIVADGALAGHIGSWSDEALRLVGYWLGREFWNRGIATLALAQFLRIERTRPLTAFVAKHNQGSIRVLEKCGFQRISEHTHSGDGVEECVYELRALSDSSSARATFHA